MSIAALILKISVYSANAPAYILPTGKNLPLHLALQTRKILFYKIASTQIAINQTQNFQILAISNIATTKSETHWIGNSMFETAF